MLGITSFNWKHDISLGEGTGEGSQRIMGEILEEDVFSKSACAQKFEFGITLI